MTTSIPRPAVASDRSDAAYAGRPDRVRAAVSLPGQCTTVDYLDARLSTHAVGWLEVESSAVCGTDIGQYRSGLPAPTVLGHHVVGRVTALDPTVAQSWDVSVGDRVALEEYLPCLQAHCEPCSTGLYRMCPVTDLWEGKRRLGMIPVAEESGLHGGNAEFMQLSYNSIVHRLPHDLESSLAAWTQPFANAIDWVVDNGGARDGSTVVIIGPGYHGISAVAAAQSAGAEKVVVIGLPQDLERLQIAESLGAVPLVNDDPTELVSAINRSTGGRGTDVLLDTVGLGGLAVSVAAHTLRKLGRLVVGGLGAAPSSDLDLKALVRGANSVIGVRGRSSGAVTRSIDILASGRSGLDLVPSVNVSLDEIDEMFSVLGTICGPASPHVVIRPHKANERRHARTTPCKE